MTTAWPHLKRLVQRLGFQIAFLLAVALLPLSIISVLTATNAERDARARSEQALIGLTMTAVTDEVALIQQTQGAAAALALVAGGPACNDLMHRVALDHPDVALVAFIGTAGDLRCSSVPLVYDFTADKVFSAALASDGPAVAVSRSGPVTRNSILLVSHPVRDSSGQKVGMIAITLPHGAFKSPRDPGQLEILTFDSEGEVLTASSGMDTAALQLPQDETLKNLSQDQSVAFFGHNKAGDGRVFAAVPIVGSRLFALGTWPEAPKSDMKSTLLSAPFLAPLLMWFASLIVAWLGVERLVIRSIRKLGQSMRSFASGSRMVGDIDMRGTPLEIREMACAYRQMTDSIIRDEAALEDTVHQKEVLLREVHHRVKNNLQLIASIMSMHIRKAQNSETREVIRKLQDRVMSLATIHRELYQTVGLTDVHAAELLSSITTQVIKLSALPDRSVAVSKSFDEVVLTPDQAVPLALLLAEALGNALKYDASSTQHTVAIEVSLRALPDGRAVLQVSHSVAVQSGASRPILDNDTLSVQLLAAFAAQLGGDIQRATDQHTSRLVIEFALRPLTDAEARNAG
ncbi:MAG: HAMP domain-containing protein [Candidatus Saccharibacteria bacterium]|nr:HAMP domain-containing protein [Pseudorhodobacter sp.]